MLASELRDSFLVMYKIECQKRGVQEIIPPDKVIAFWISQAQLELCDRLNLLLTYYDLYYDAGTEFINYDLPDDFGKLISTEPELQIKNISELKTLSTTENPLLQGEVYAIAIYEDGDGHKAGLAGLPSSSGIVRLWYTKNTELSSNSNSGDDVGFDGTSFMGEIVIPQKYISLLLLYLLGQYFNDKQAEFEAKVERAKSNSGTTETQEITYNLGY